MLQQEFQFQLQNCQLANVAKTKSLATLSFNAERDNECYVFGLCDRGCWINITNISKKSSLYCKLALLNHLY